MLEYARMNIADVDKIIADSFPNLAGWCPVPKGQRMARLVMEGAALFPEAHAGPLCVELGVFGGRGVIAMGLAVKHLLGDHGAVHGIDPFSVDAALEGQNSSQNQKWWSEVDYAKILAGAVAAINGLGLHGVKLILRKSEDVAGDYADGSIDVLHIDGNHSVEVSRKDVALWAPKVRPEGFIVFDDTNWETTKPAQNDMRDRGFALLEQHDTWAIYKAPR